MGTRNLIDAAVHFGGVEATARWQGQAEQLEKLSSPRREMALRPADIKWTGHYW